MGFFVVFDFVLLNAVLATVYVGYEAGFRARVVQWHRNRALGMRAAYRLLLDYLILCLILIN